MKQIKNQTVKFHKDLDGFSASYAASEIKDLSDYIPPPPLTPSEIKQKQESEAWLRALAMALLMEDINAPVE